MTQKLTREESLFKAVSQGKFRTVYAILESEQDPDIRDSEHWTPLMRAIYLKREDVRSHIVRLLIKYKADVNLRDQFGRTALIHACGVIGRLDVVRRLIATTNCDVCAYDQDGNTAVMYATLKNNPSAIRILVNSAFTKDRVRIDMRNCIDETALSIAVHLGHKDCANILINEGSANTALVSDQSSLYKLMEARTSFHRISISSKMKRGQSSMCSLDEAMHSLSSIKLDKISLHSRSSVTSKLEDDTLVSCSTEMSVEPQRDSEERHLIGGFTDKGKGKAKKHSRWRRSELPRLTSRNLTTERIEERSEPEEIIALKPFDFDKKNKPLINAFSSNMLGFSGGHHRFPSVSKKRYAFVHSRNSVL